jgi:hypothetical protein
MWTPIAFRNVEALPLFLDNRLRQRWGCQTYAPAALYPPQDSWYSFLLQSIREEETVNVNKPSPVSPQPTARSGQSAQLVQGTHCIRTHVNLNSDFGHPCKGTPITWSLHDFILRAKEISRHVHLFTMTFSSPRMDCRGWVDPKAIVLLEGLDQLKNPVISSGIEPATFLLVAQSLPPDLIGKLKKTGWSGGGMWLKLIKQGSRIKRLKVHHTVKKVKLSPCLTN